MAVAAIAKATIAAATSLRGLISKIDDDIGETSCPDGCVTIDD